MKAQEPAANTMISEFRLASGPVIHKPAGLSPSPTGIISDNLVDRDYC